MPGKKWLIELHIKVFPCRSLSSTNFSRTLSAVIANFPPTQKIFFFFLLSPPPFPPYFLFSLFLGARCIQHRFKALVEDTLQFHYCLLMNDLQTE